MALPVTTNGPDPPSCPEADKFEQSHIWHRFREWIGKSEHTSCPEAKQRAEPGKPSLGRRLSRRVVPGLPRPTTFRRQNSERRERLTPVEPVSNQRPPQSVDRRRALSARPVPSLPQLSKKRSAPTIRTVGSRECTQLSPRSPPNEASQASDHPPTSRPVPPPSPPPDNPPAIPPEIPPDVPPLIPSTMSEISFNDDIDEQIKAELEEKWILNLSMHFRDKSPREKFFVTYAEIPTLWRRVTVSCDYRDAPPKSLERDLQALHYQSDKSERIYEAIRMSLPDIQFYDTVTNLKLETSQDDRLHVHVTEDVNEIIPYPSTRAVQHLDYTRVLESEVKFESHMSGFVYKVRVHGQICIKKEIPGPDSVEEFLYEINALHALKGARNVIQFQGLVIDEKNNLVKGLLISFAEHGPLVDMIYDYKGTLDWSRRERWAKQIVRGLSEIHEAGFVQGDFTLSNIVIDEHDRAQIIDINRRGCPVGWEPPELARLVENGQRISIYIGVKSDIFQLGMVLWALGQEEDEPERQHRPLSLRASTKEMPQYYRDLTDRCLSHRAVDRLAARDLLTLFPNLSTDNPTPPPSLPQPSPRFSISSETHYPNDFDTRQLSSGSHTYIDRHDSIDIPFDNSGSYMVSRPGRQSPVNGVHGRYSSSGHARHYSRPAGGSGDAQIVPVSPGGNYSWEEVEVDGRRYIVQRSSLELDDPVEARQRRGRSRLRMGEVRGMGRIPGVEHVDSGLADMELTGVGGHEMLRGYAGNDVGDDDVKLEESNENKSQDPSEDQGQPHGEKDNENRDMHEQKR